VISGIVTDRYAIASLPFLLVNGATFPIEFVIDTGFTDRLCLPPEALKGAVPGYWLGNKDLESNRIIPEMSLTER
jgi:hypothetical protein